MILFHRGIIGFTEQNRQQACLFCYDCSLNTGRVYVSMYLLKTQMFFREEQRGRTID